MAGLGIAVIVGAVVASMALAMYAYTEYQPNLITAKAGEPVVVGPVEYVVTFEGTHNGSKEKRPENTFVGVGIVARNISPEPTNFSGGQFHLYDGSKNHVAVYGEFSATDLLFEELVPGEPVQRSTQFDIPFDEEKRYDLVIRPQKDQSSVDMARVCLVNC